MRWCAAIALVLALVASYAWHPPVELGFHVSATTAVGYPINYVVFWLLVAIALRCLLGHFIQKRVRGRPRDSRSGDRRYS
jgi:hypothetical protein